MTPFDYIKIYMNGHECPEITKDYGALRFIINRGMSLYPDALFLANDMNMNPGITNEMHRDFLFYATRKYKRPFAKWPKDVAEEDLKAVQEYYGYNQRKARQALAILTEDELMHIRTVLDKGGLKNERASRDASGSDAE